MDVIVCHHDTEDNNPSNSLFSDDNYYNDINHFMGYTKIDNDVTLAWGFPSNGAPFLVLPIILVLLVYNMVYYRLPMLQQERFIVMMKIAIIRIGCKDIILDILLDNSFNESVALNDFGITENGNTTYSISLSTDAKFSKK